MKKSVLFILLLLINGFVFSQPWMQYLPQSKAQRDLTFFDYQNAFKKWCEIEKIDKYGYHHEDGGKIKAGGWKQFKRWEIQMEGMYDDKTGEIYRINPLKEWEKFESAYRSTDGLAGNWTQVGYNYSNGGYDGIGRLNTIAFHPTDRNTFWVGAPWGGLWRTDDYGQTWTPLTDNIGQIGISAILVPPDFETSGVMLIGTGDRGHWGDMGVGILKSTDWGETWQTTDLGYTDPLDFYVGRILIHPSIPTRMYAATSLGIYKSIDAGESWELLYSCRGIDMEFHPTDPSIIYVSTRGDDFGNTNVIRTTDNGVNWDKSKFSHSGCRTEIAVSPDQPDWIYALTSNWQRGLQGIYLSTDKGLTYTLLLDGSDSTNNILNGACEPNNFKGGQGSYDLCIIANPNNADEVMIGGVNLWKSYDAGENWEVTTTWDGNCTGVQQVHADHHWLDYQYDSDTVFVCNDGGVYYSYDFGETWTDITNGLFITQIYRVTNAPNSYGEALFGCQDNGTRRWHNGTFYQIGGGDGTDCLINPYNQNNQYFTNNGCLMQYTTDGWATGHEFSVTNDSTDSWYKAIALVPPSTVYFGLTNLWKSTDYGATLNLLWDLPDTTLIRRIVPAPSSPNIIYLLTKFNFYKTIDGGVTWDTLSDSFPEGFNEIDEIIVKNTDPNVVWMTENRWGDGVSVLRSGDGGLTWVNISEGLPDAPMLGIVQNELNTNVEELYACGYYGVFIKMGDLPWALFNEGLPNVNCYRLDIYYNGENSMLRVGTHGRGLWQSNLYSTAAGPGTWIGAEDDNWHNPDNWASSEVPVLSTNVTIPSAVPHLPKITYGMGVCNNLTLLAGASLTVNGNYLSVDENMTLYGQLIMTGAGSEISVTGSVTWEYGSSMLATGTGNMFYVDGDWAFRSGSQAHLDNVTVRFLGLKTTKILSESSNSYFSNLQLEKFHLNYTCRVLSLSTASLLVKGDLTINSTTKFFHDSDSTLIVEGDFISSGVFYFQKGTFKPGNTSQISSTSSTSYFQNLLIDTDGTCTVLSDIQLRGDLMLAEGSLDLNGFTLKIFGNIDKTTSGSLDQNGGVVRFCGIHDQTILQNMSFSNVELDNDTHTLFIKRDKTVSFGSYDWTSGALALEVGAQLTIYELVDDGLRGSFTAPVDADLTIHNPTGSVDLNGKMIVNGGIVTVYGGNHASYWPGSANAEIHLSSGTLDFKDRGIYILDNPSFTLLDNITGGVIRSPYGFQGNHHAFTPTGGYIELYGTGDAELGHGIGSSFYKVVINKQTASDDVTVVSNLDIDNNLNIDAGNLDINGYTVDVAGALDITGKLTMINAASTLNAGTSVTWRPGSSSYILSGLITFKTLWSFLDGTSAMLAGTNTVKVIGNQPSIIQHKDADARMNNLVIEKTGSLTTLDESSAYPLRLNEDLTVKSGNTLRVLNADVWLAGTFLAESSSTIMLAAGGSIDAGTLLVKNTFNVVNGSMLEGGTVNIQGTMNLVDGGQVVFDDMDLSGTLDINAGSVLLHNSFTQATGGHLVLDGGSFVINKPYTGSMFGFSGTTDLNGGFFEISYEGIIFGSGAVVNFNGGNLRIGGHFQATAANSFKPSSGAVEFINTIGSNINVANGNYFNQLIFNKTAGAGACMLASDVVINDQLILQSGELQTLGNTLTVNGDLLIQTSGKLTAGASEIYVGGSWLNNRGTIGFAEGTSSVWMVSGHEATLSSETFYYLDVDKPLNTGDYLTLADNAILTVNNKLTLDDGVLMIGYNGILNCNGDLHFKSGGGLTFSISAYDAVLNIKGNWWDYNTLTTADQGFSPVYSTVVFNGTADQEIVATGGVNFYNLTFNNPGNSIIINDNVSVEQAFTLTAGEWYPATSGLTHTFEGNFTVSDPALWQDDLNTISFNGEGSQTISCTTPGWLNFYNVEVNRPLLAESGSLEIESDISCDSRFSLLEGSAALDGYRLMCNIGLDVESGASFMVFNDATVALGNDASLHVDGGTLYASGTEADRALFTRISTGYYEFLVENGGSVNASYSDFEYMNGRGVNIYSSGFVGGSLPFNHCTFSKTEATGTLLQINNSQELTLYNVDFPANTWSGTYNISKTATSGNIIMHNASGSFGGPVFEDDDNGLIHWPSCGVWEGDYSTEWHDRANWRFDYQYPDINTDVVIPSGTPYYPVVSTQTARINSLWMGSNTSLVVNQYGVIVTDYSDIAGYLEIAGTNTTLSSDSLVWQQGSSAYLSTTSRIDITGNMFIRHGSNLNLNAGNIYFYGNGESQLICHDTAQVYELYNYKNSPYSLSLVGDTLARLTVKGYFRNGPGATLRCPSSQEWQFMSALVNTASDNGHFRCENGTFRLKGNTGSLFRINSGDYFNNLIIETPSKISLYGIGTVDTLRVKGNLVINSPSTSGITANAFKILIWGDWINNVGTNAFNAGTSKVVFMDPSVPQAVQGNTNFYNLTAGDWESSTVNFYGQNTINNVFESFFTTNVYGTLNASQVFSDNDFAFLNVYDGGAVTFSNFQQGAPVHVYDGTFTVNDLFEDYVKSNYTIDDGLISLGQTYSPTASHDLYYASIIINGGELRFTGGNGVSLWPRASGQASVTMSAGIFDLTNQEVVIKPTGFTENITGGMIRTTLGFSADPTATNFNPTGGTVELYGTEDCSFSMPEPNCWFHNLWLSTSDEGGAYPSSNIRVKNEFRLKTGAYTETDGYTITVGP